MEEPQGFACLGSTSLSSLSMVLIAEHASIAFFDNRPSSDTIGVRNVKEEFVSHMRTIAVIQRIDEDLFSKLALKNFDQRYWRWSERVARDERLQACA